MRYNSVAAIVAAEIAISFRLRPRLVQLTPRAFYLLTRNRNRNISPTSHRSISDTAVQRSEFTSQAHLGNPSINDCHDKRETQPPDASNTQRDGPVSEHTSEERKDIARYKTFLDLMRSVPHPVAVITARRQDIEDEIQGTVAATVSSFNTVCMKPEQIISFNLKADSITYQTIVDSNYFTVTFAQMNSAGADLIDSFTKGNNPSPFTVEHPHRPTPRPFSWANEQRELLPNLKYHPPTVALADLDDSRKSGFAFAFICEYQTSTPIGDHVIVSGRLTSIPFKTANPGWTENHRRRPFTERNVTLTHVHGTYSNEHTGPGFIDNLRLDEALDINHRNGTQSKRKISLCKRRLKVIAIAQLMQQGANTKNLVDAQSTTALQLIPRVAAMQPDLLQKYERYYMQRLRYWELKSRQETGEEATLQPEGTTSDQADPSTESYENLEGHEKLFIHTKMLLNQIDLDEEISLYQTRLSKLEIQELETPETHAIDIETESADERTPEETEPDPNSITANEAALRNKRLIEYFKRRVFLLEQAKLRKIEFSQTSAPLEQKLKKEDDAPAMRRFLGVQKTETLQGLKTKYRRYQSQIMEARLSLIGLEEIPGGHENIPILKERIEYFTPRLQIIETCIKERAKASTAKDLLLDNFKLPAMRPPEDDSNARRNDGPRLNRPIIRTIPDKKLYRTHGTEPEFEVRRLQLGDSVDQLDDSATEDVARSRDIDRTSTVVKEAAKKLPVGIDPNIAARRVPLNDQVAVTPAQGAERENRMMEDVDKDLLRRNADKVRDFLVLQGDEGEDMPSPNDFIDAAKIRDERRRKEEEVKQRQEQGQ